ncbi:GFA family protein [Neoaquamicrobium sediminum]|uniref:GFA family protein n=1 Tax=Neoaquamicrobium sediminum TaxID=1849104 RepID=UPI001566A37F|nr:GFA family protein [Mesorhizobium sediminum]NRC56422.1 GFA family protein [Mesorhizobium sediminum]
MQPESWNGGCLCGSCRYTVSGKPSHVGYCHCSMCRRATGGPFAVLVRVEGQIVEWSRVPASYRSSPIATRGFCPTCGTPLYLQYDGDSRIRLLVGTVDQPDSFVPQSHYGVEGRLKWIDCNAGLPEEETTETW